MRFSAFRTITLVSTFTLLIMGAMLLGNVPNAMASSASSNNGNDFAVVNNGNDLSAVNNGNDFSAINNGNDFVGE